MLQNIGLCTCTKLLFHFWVQPSCFENIGRVNQCNTTSAVSENVMELIHKRWNPSWVCCSVLSVCLVNSLTSPHSSYALAPLPLPWTETRLYPVSPWVDVSCSLTAALPLCQIERDLVRGCLSVCQPESSSLGGQSNPFFLGKAPARPEFSLRLQVLRGRIEAYIQQFKVLFSAYISILQLFQLDHTDYTLSMPDQWSVWRLRNENGHEKNEL